MNSVPCTSTCVSSVWDLWRIRVQEHERGLFKVFLQAVRELTEAGINPSLPRLLIHIVSSDWREFDAELNTLKPSIPTTTHKRSPLFFHFETEHFLKRCPHQHLLLQALTPAFWFPSLDCINSLSREAFLTKNRFCVCSLTINLYSYGRSCHDKKCCHRFDTVYLDTRRGLFDWMTFSWLLVFQ